MPRTNLIFGDIEGQARVLRVEMHQVRPQGPLSGSQADREVRAHGQYFRIIKPEKRLPEPL